MTRSLLTLAVLACLLFCCCRQQEPPPVDKVHSYVSMGIDSIHDWLSNEFIVIARTKSDPTELQHSFFKGRRLYKRIELAIEYFFPNASRNINGPPLPEIETEEHIVLEPGGFQVIEELIFPFDTAHRTETIREISKLKSILVRVKSLWEETNIREDQVFDAMRQECTRIITLGITGFDTPISLDGLNEIESTLSSVKAVLSWFDDKRKLPILQQTSQQVDQAIAFANNHPGFSDFDRLRFIRDHMNPLSRNLLYLQKELGIPVMANVFAVRGNTGTIFDSDAFNVNYFTPDLDSYTNPASIKLGKKLFSNPILSENNKISCASCHHPEKGFTDGQPKSPALGTAGFLKRNTPSLINAALQKAQFYDMRSTFLEDQVKTVVESTDEIHGSLQKAVIRLNNDSNYKNLFREAFLSESEINERSIQVALSAYIRSLTLLDSRFDLYMRGDTSKMSAQEIKGFNIFMGKAKCGTCHFMPVFNGTVPPAFTITESEVIGVPSDKNSKIIDSDPGRFGIYQIEHFRNAFKTPSVRNVALTAPYMHNGIFSTLEEVVDFYDKGGGKGSGIQISNQTLPDDSLHLTAPEKRALVAFMKSLTDSTLEPINYKQ